MSRILTIALTAFLLSTSMAADPSPAATSPHPRTEGALKCFLGIGAAACGKNDGCNRGDGPLEKVDYLGTNAAGADVYEVRYMHADSVYVSAPPGPNVTIDQFRSWRGNPNQILSPKVHVTARSGTYLIYTRPQNSPTAGCSTVLSVESPPQP